MPLNTALQIGQSAILTSQAAIQVAGNNMANATTPGFHRQVAGFTPAGGTKIGTNSFVGNGVMLRDISRVVDTALQTRIRSALSHESGANIDQRFLSSIESLQNELSDNDLSTRLSGFFNAFSELANNPDDDAVRSLTLQTAGGIATQVRGLRVEYTRVREELDRSLDSSVEKADGLLEQIAAVNSEITLTEQGNSKANGLRDKRDELLVDLSKLVDISTVEQPNGSMDVFVGSLPVVLGSDSRGIELRTTNQNGATGVEVRISADGSILNVDDGEIGALRRQRDDTVNPAIDALDTFTKEFVYQVNRVHSQGQGKVGWTSVTGTVDLDDPTTAFNATATAMPFTMQNGSFLIHVTNTATGLRTSAQVLVDPNTMSLNGLSAAINATGLVNLTASVTPDARLKIDATPGYEVTFSEDSSGALAALGVNALFSGTDAVDIEINPDLLDDPRLLASGLGHTPGSNGSALAMVELENSSITALNGRSLRTYWQGQVNTHAVRTSAAINATASATLVRQGLQAQEDAVSGVSLDEESIDLLSYQRQFQAAARFVATIDEAMQTLLDMV